ncbi:hypothetical protein HK405_011465, partial [Cladochytrium tenue]
MTSTTTTAMDPALATENHTEEPDRIGRKVSAAGVVKRNDSKVRFGRNKASTPVPAEATGPEDEDDGTAYPSTAEFDHPAAGDVEEAPVPPDSTGTATLARTLNARSKNLRTLSGKKSAGSFTTLSRKTVSRTKSQSNLGAEGNGAEPAAAADGDQPIAKDDAAGAAPATLPRKPTWFGTMRGTVGRSSLSRSSSVADDDDDASASEEERQNRKKYAEAVRSLNWGMWKKGVEAMDALAADGAGVEKAVIFLDPAQSPFKNPTGCWYLGRLCEEKAEKLQQQLTEPVTSVGGETGLDGHAAGAMTDALVHEPIDEDAPTPEERRRDLLAKALAWFAIGAHGGYPPAMISMAKMLSSGAGTDNGIPNIGLSIKWLYRAYKAPNQTPGAQSEAAEILGKLYLNGVSSPTQTDSADFAAAPSPGELDWAAMSDQEASLHTSVPQDLSLATQWLRRAARRSNTTASETLASLSEIEPHNARADAVDHIRHGRFRTGIQGLWDLEAQGFPDAVRDLDPAVSTLPAATARRNVEGGHKPNAAIAGWVGVFLLGVAARERRASILLLTPPKFSDDDGDDDEDARIAAAADPSNPAQRDDAVYASALEVRAVEWFRLGARLGDPVSLVRLGAWWVQGHPAVGGAPDPAVAMACYTAAWDAGRPSEAAEGMGMLLAAGNEDADPNAALEGGSTAAVRVNWPRFRHDPESARGLAFSRDLPAARRWLARAAFKASSASSVSSAKAESALGVLLLTGGGRPSDPPPTPREVDQGMYHLARAAKKGLPWAMKKYGQALVEGKGTRKSDADTGRAWIEKAVAAAAAAGAAHRRTPAAAAATDDPALAAAAEAFAAADTDDAAADAALEAAADAAAAAAAATTRSRPNTPAA